LITIYIDADGCPVKNEVYKVALRYKLRVFVVSNSKIVVPNENTFEPVIVEGTFDAADDWIVHHVTPKDIVVSTDIPLAARCIQKGARAIDSRGRVFTQESIGSLLATRDLMTFLRDQGDMTGGPPPFQKRDRSRFLQELDTLIQKIFKEMRQPSKPGS
jgi:uncharacterized protein YaiI (UPF0178 family)